MVLTPCVLFSELLTQWAEATLLSKFFTFDNLSRSNPCFVINNFIHKEDIHMRIFKKILTIILSIGLLFLVSCGNDDKTGSSPSNPVNIDEIINSIPTTEGKPPATDLNVEAVYKGKLTGSYTTIIGEQSGSGEIQGGGTEIILAITNNFIHFGYIDTEYTESPDGNPTSPTKTTRIVLTNAQLYQDGSLYIAGKNEEGIGSFGIEEEQLPCKNICYIEFTKPDDNTEIKRAIDATSFESKNYVNKLEYKGTLIKDTSSSGS